MKTLKLVVLGIKNNKRAVLKFLIPVLLLELLSIFLLYRLNSTYGNLYQALTDYKSEVIWYSLKMFTGIAMTLVLVDGYANFYINRLAFELRIGLTLFCLNNAANLDQDHFFPQRVQEDVAKFSSSICDLWTSIFRAVVKLPVFLYVIIGLTKWYIGLAVVIAVVVATLATKIAASRLVPLQAVQEGNEANFRSNLNHTRFLTVTKQFLMINKRSKILSFVQSGAQQLFVLLPFMILMPLYIAKTVTVKGFFQSVNALGKIIQSLLVVIDNRQLIVQIESCGMRLEFLQNKN